MRSQRSITLLHLSDPQFGPKHRFDGAVPGSLFARLRDDFVEMRERHGLVPDIILVTGDLVETGKPSEFKRFRAFAEAAVEHFGLPRRRLVMIPGNHDINRAAAEAYFKDCESDERVPKPPYWPKLRHYAAMFAEFYADEPDITFTESAPYSVFRYPELGVVVAGLNSTIADSHRADDHYGFIGEEQLRHFASELHLAADQGLLRIGAVHHPPGRPESEAARQDLRDLKRFLGPYLNLVVHGHIHEDELDWLDNTTPVLGIGSAGVTAMLRPEEVPNQYQWIRVLADSIEYGSRAYVPDQKRWVGDLRLDRGGERWWQRRAVAFERVSALTSTVTAAATANDDLARVVASHRAAVVRQLRQRPLLVDLATYGEDGDLAHGLELLTIFIPQRTMQEIPRSDRPGELQELRRRVDADSSAETVGPVESIAEVVSSASHPWTLVLGTPGAGKTTLTMWLALKLCAEGEALAGLSADLVPVRVELRLFVERWSTAHAQGRSYDFFDYLDDLHREESRALRGGALRELAAAGRLLWLFDGLDEVASAAHRAEISTMITGVRVAHGGRGVITGRIVGCRHLRARFHAADIHCFTLLDLSDPQIDEFLQRWHTLAFPRAPELGARRQERLRQTLDANPAVRDLCRNPLLLTLIALLNRGDELPRRRHKLLERASELMLTQWEANKELPPGNAVQFDPTDKRRYLAELAWYMLTELPEGPGNVIEGEVLERFTVGFCQRRFQASPQPAAATARALVSHLRERNYVLGLLGGTQFGYLHKAFFEYFAAEEAVHRFRSQLWRVAEIKRLFLEYWRADGWNEVLILVCGLLQEDSSEPVVAALQAVLGSPGWTERGGWTRSLAFAVGCLAEVRRLESGPALALVLALNRHIRSVLHFESMTGDPWFWFGDEAEIRLRRSLHVVGGAWPGAEQVLAESVDDPIRPTPSGTTLQTFLAALGSEARISWYLRLLDEHRLSIDALHEAAAEGLWGQADDMQLRQQMRRAAGLSPTVVLAVADLLLETRPGAVPIAELLELAPSVMQEPLRVLLSRVQPADANPYKVRLKALARLALSGLSAEGVEQRVSLLGWPILVGIGKPNGKVIEHLRAALGVDFERPDVALRIAHRWHDRASLRRALTAHSTDPRDILADNAFVFSRWPEGFEVALEWLRDLAERYDAHRLSRVLEALERPGQSVGAMEVERALRMSATSDGAPDWFVLERASGYIRGFEADEFLRCVDAVLSVHKQRPLEAALYVLSYSVQYAGDDGTPWWDDVLLARFVELLDRALTDQPWLALAYLAILPDAEEAKVVARVSTPEFVARLQGSSLAGLRDQTVRSASIRARKIAGLPWELPLRHLLAHGTDPVLQVKAALELGDWAWLQRVATTGPDELRAGAQAALDVAETLADVLRAGRLRRAEVRRGGVRVGRLVELQGGPTRFVYDGEYLAQATARPIAPNLPLRAEPFDSPGLHPVFEGLLPQGWLLDIDVKKYRLKSGDQFGLLLATGRHTIGAIEIVPEEELT